MITIDALDARKRVVTGRSRSRSPTATRRIQSSSGGRDAVFWNETANSLSREMTQLRESLAVREREYASLFELNAKVLSSYRELELKMTDAERELAYLRADPFGETCYTTRSLISAVPVNTQGKDALYWHQMCRTIQSQYLQSKHEADEKTNQCIILSNRIKELESLLRDRQPK